MSERKYFVICEDNCKFEGMTKEQILTAITQAVNQGTVGDIDTGFVTTIKTIDGTPLKFFVGTQARYDALTEAQKENLFAIITNDTAKERIEETLSKILDGSIAVESATNAVNAESADRAENLEAIAFYPVATQTGDGGMRINLGQKSGLYLFVLTSGYTPTCTYPYIVPVDIPLEVGQVGYISTSFGGENDVTCKIEVVQGTNSVDYIVTFNNGFTIVRARCITEWAVSVG